MVLKNDREGLTFFATKSTMIKVTIKHPAAILAVRRVVDASIKTIPQNDEPRSGGEKKPQKIINVLNIRVTTLCHNSMKC